MNSSLVREKITIIDKESNGKEQVVIRSNRFSFTIGNHPAVENIVVRAQNMHATLRFAS